MKCIVQGCERERSQRRRMCASHYQRQWKYGDPRAGETEKGLLAAWLRQHATYASDDCLTWPYGQSSSGHGSVTLNGYKTSASRAMCLLAHGLPPDGHEAAHSCGKGHLGCVNPRHLRWATRLENVHDAMRHGTTSKGQKHSQAIRKGLGIDVDTLTKEARDAA
jgi:hypothetical protein